MSDPVLLPPALDPGIPPAEIVVPINVDVAIAKFGAAYHARGKREALSTEPEIDDSEYQHRRLRSSISDALREAVQTERERCAVFAESRMDSKRSEGNDAAALEAGAIAFGIRRAR